MQKRKPADQIKDLESAIDNLESEVPIGEIAALIGDADEIKKLFAPQLRQNILEGMKAGKKELCRHCGRSEDKNDAGAREERRYYTNLAFRLVALTYQGRFGDMSKTERRREWSLKRKLRQATEMPDKHHKMTEEELNASLKM